MVPTTPLQFLLEQGPTPVRAFSSLTKRDMAAVNAAVRASGGGFAIEEHDDYDGYLSLLLSPGQEGRPAYLISGRTGAVDLAEIRGDDMIALGSGFASIGAAMTVLRPALDAWFGANAQCPPGRAPDRAAWPCGPARGF